MKEKSFIVEKFFDREKMVSLSLLKMKSIKQILLFETLRYLFLNQEQKLCLTFCGRQNQYYFCFVKNHSHFKSNHIKFDLPCPIEYRISSIKCRNTYLKLKIFDAAVNRGQRLFEGDTCLRVALIQKLIF